MDVPEIAYLLTVHYSSQPGLFDPALDEVWERRQPTPFLPAPGDEVVLWPGDDGQPTTGQCWPVVRRRYDNDGTPWVELINLRVDPDPVDIRLLPLVDPPELAWLSHQHPTVVLDRDLASGGWKRIR